MRTAPDHRRSALTPGATRHPLCPVRGWRGGRGGPAEDHTRRRTRPSFLVLLACTLAACTADSPERPAGTFVLEATQRGPLPAVLGDRENCIYSAVGGSVTLQEDHFDALMLRERRCLPVTSADSIPVMVVDTLHDRGQGTFDVVGDSLFFRSDRGTTAGVGVLLGDSLAVEGPLQTLHYRREPLR